MFEESNLLKMWGMPSGQRSMTSLISFICALTRSAERRSLFVTCSAVDNGLALGMPSLQHRYPTEASELRGQVGAAESLAQC